MFLFPYQGCHSSSNSRHGVPETMQGASAMETDLSGLRMAPGISNEASTVGAAEGGLQVSLSPLMYIVSFRNRLPSLAWQNNGSNRSPPSSSKKLVGDL